MIPSQPGCYILNFIESGKFYIGSTGNLRRRYNDHMSGLTRGVHRNIALQRVYDNDDQVVFEYITASDREEAYDQEQIELDKYIGHPQCINQCNDARTHWIPGSRPVEFQERVNASLRGLKRTEDQVERIRQAALRRPPVSEATRDKLSAAGRGRPNTERQNELIRQSRLGVKRKESDIVTRKRVVIDGITYASIQSAIEAVGVTRTTMNKRLMDERYPGWHYV